MDINESAYADFVSQNDVVLLDFYTTWCGPCRALTPILQKLQEDSEGK